MKLTRFILIYLFFFLAVDGHARMLRIQGGTFTPLYGSLKKPVSVSSFLINENPVTNNEFLKFVQEFSQWQKSKVKTIFAEKNYLKHWKNNNELGPLAPADSPVVNISWYAANSFCEAMGQRLPTVNEWEYVAAQEIPGQDLKSIILTWYAVPTPEILPSVKSGFKNKTGVANMHGLIWEWTLDFNSTMVTGESRADGNLDKTLFCGSGSSGAADSSDYAAFMRFSYRSSVKANYTISNLGFRCVQDESK